MTFEVPDFGIEVSFIDNRPVKKLEMLGESYMTNHIPVMVNTLREIADKLERLGR